MIKILQFITKAKDALGKIFLFLGLNEDVLIKISAIIKSNYKLYALIFIFLGFFSLMLGAI